MDDYYALKNRGIAVAQIMADHAEYVAEQARMDAIRAAAINAIRAAAAPEELACDELYRADPGMF